MLLCAVCARFDIAALIKQAIAQDLDAAALSDREDYSDEKYHKQILSRAYAHYESLADLLEASGAGGGICSFLWGMWLEADSRETELGDGTGSDDETKSEEDTDAIILEEMREDPYCHGQIVIGCYLDHDVISGLPRLFVDKQMCPYPDENVVSNSQATMMLGEFEFWGDEGRISCCYHAPMQTHLSSY